MYVRFGMFWEAAEEQAFATLHASAARLFSCRPEDIAVGSLIANRNQIEIEQLIGMFANAIVLRTDLSGDPTFSDLLRRVRQITLDAYRNQDLPIEKILQALRVQRSVDRNSLFQVKFILQNASPKALTLPGLSTSFVDVVKKVAGLPFDALFIPDTAARAVDVTIERATATRGWT
jgi:non-ribosomal peptide synthetase component F